jgi:hypothetical protein
LITHGDTVTLWKKASTADPNQSHSITTQSQNHSILLNSCFDVTQSSCNNRYGILLDINIDIGLLGNKGERPVEYWTPKQQEVKMLKLLCYSATSK